jgi:serine/threonine-protein kinase
MGEVYRADDLSLGQSVALKFLPQRLAHDADRLARLRGEVKSARQVAHPNVCRVYDLGQADGQLFLSMEYIDGQNLASLLTQVRRLPEERGVEIARQLCLGLAAIHDRGLLHRDLKPANVMLDGRGQVRITDFGLATPAADLQPEDIRDGTPAYQSPEQLAGREVTLRSDVYALGLILYELFTGKPAFAATDRAALARSHAEDPPSKPSSHVSGLNPAIEKIILQCLEKDPRDRPRSAYEVLAGLPGGDPLAAALAAGQTPSPAVVADAPIEGTLHPLVAVTMLVATVGGLALALALASGRYLWELVPSQLSPRDLAGRAQETIKQFGYTEQPLDKAYGLNDSEVMLHILRDRDPSAQRWKPLATGQPPAMFFWYRQSPQWMVPHINVGNHAPIGYATADNPPLNTPGMVRLCLDLKGRLIEFQCQPALDPPSQPPPALDWAQILSQAGLAQIQPTQEMLPGWSPPLFVDERLAWRGVYAECPDIPVRAEAGLRNGRLVFFHAAPEHRRTTSLSLFAASPSVLVARNMRDSSGSSLLEAFQALLLIIALAMAWHNFRTGRANVHGSAILAALVVACSVLSWLFSAHHVPDYSEETMMLSVVLGDALTSAVQVGAAYMALEPMVRRRWPSRVVAWNRLLAGRWRDPLVGRDILIGCLAVVVLALVAQSVTRFGSWLGRPPDMPFVAYNPAFTLGPAFGLPAMVNWNILRTFAVFFIVFLLYALTRRVWLAGVLAGVLGALPTLLAPPGDREFQLLLVVIAMTIFLTVLLRFGLLALAAMSVTDTIRIGAPMTLDMDAWYAGSGLVYLSVLVALAVYGFVVASGGQWLGWVRYLTREASDQPQPAT